MVAPAVVPPTSPTTPRPTGVRGTTTPTYTTSASDRARVGRHGDTSTVIGLGGVSPLVGASLASANGSPPTTTASGIAALIGTAPPTGPGAIGGLTGGSTTGGRAGSVAGAGKGDTDGTSGRPVAAVAASRPTVIQRLEHVIPTGIWFVLAAALGLAAASGAWGLYSQHRVRRAAGAFAAMSMAALTDQLTGVLNRRGFTEAVERELARARRYDRPFVLAYIDVRGLKAVNDTEGHRAGDELLKATARLLEDSARADDVVGRIGGDEMGVLLVEQSEEGATAVRRRIESQVQARRESLGLRTDWDLTIGTAAYPEDGETVDDLLRAADLRLYEQRGIDLI